MQRFRLSSHFLPNLVFNQIAMADPTTAIMQNNPINAPISFYFIILCKYVSRICSSYKTATALRMLSNITDNLLSRRAVCIS